MLKMLFLLFVAAVLVGNIYSLTRKQANQYIENVLENRFLEEVEYNRLDPYKLDDIKVALNKSKGRDDGSATLTKGKLLNLSKVRRSTNCTEPHWVSSNVSFACFIRFEGLRINYTANVHFDDADMEFYPYVTISGTNITLEINSNPEEDIPRLKSFFLNRLGNITVISRMISIGDSHKFIEPQIRTTLSAKTTQTLHRVLYGRFKDALAYSIYKTPVGFNR